MHRWSSTNDLPCSTWADSYLREGTRCDGNSTTSSGSFPHRGSSSPSSPRSGRCCCSVSPTFESYSPSSCQPDHFSPHPQPSRQPCSVAATRSQSGSRPRPSNAERRSSKPGYPRLAHRGAGGSVSTSPHPDTHLRSGTHPRPFSLTRPPGLNETDPTRAAIDLTTCPICQREHAGQGRHRSPANCAPRGHSPVLPSSSSLVASACPAWRAVSLMRWRSTQRRSLPSAQLSGSEEWVIGRDRTIASVAIARSR